MNRIPYLVPLPAALLSMTASISLAAPLSTIKGTPDAPRTITMRSDSPLRDGEPKNGLLEFTEDARDPRISCGHAAWDAVYALACHEARLNAVSQIRDGAYQNGSPISLNAYQTGEKWPYVWTRDLAYSSALGLAALDPQRMFDTLWFKTSTLKASTAGNVPGEPRFIIQDTGSGGSWPVSSDHVAWSFGIRAVFDYLPASQQKGLSNKIGDVLENTLLRDMDMLRDPSDGLFRGEQSFLDWREQTYPAWTKDNVTTIAASKSLSTNVAFLSAMKNAAYFNHLGTRQDVQPWLRQAESLRTAIHQSFFNPTTGTYAATLLRDGLYTRRTERFDLLGTSLAVLEGVAPPEQAAAIIAHCPLGPYGPPVVAPQELGVPIYHNSAIWPFATAWWTLAAAKAQHSAAVDAGFHSITDAAERNLSNMENLDFVSGMAWASHDGIDGPVVNSRRQTWSIAGALGVFHRILFGLETTADGIRFRPMIPAKMTTQLGTTIELRNFPYQGKRIDVSVVLPDLTDASGFLTIQSTEINGSDAGTGFVPASRLTEHSHWHIRLGPPLAGVREPALQRMDPAKDFAPAAPTWADVGVSEAAGHALLRFDHPHPDQVTFTIYRDGKIAAQNLSHTQWTDPEPLAEIHEYSVEAVDAAGHSSHPAPSVRLQPVERLSILSAPSFSHTGGDLVEGSHFMNWGKPDHDLTSPAWTPGASGQHLIRVEFANGLGPVNTGITCAVKRLEILDAISGKILHSRPIVLPQSGDWKRHDLSLPESASFETGHSYRFRIRSGGSPENMSDLQQNSTYTAGNGGGENACHFVDIFAIRLLRLAP